MRTKCLMLLSVVLSLVRPAAADAGWCLAPRRSCAGPRVPCGHVVRDCYSGTATALEPITVEETYTITKPVREEVIGADGKPKTVIKCVPEERTRTRVLRTANEQIEYLKDKLIELDRQRVTPLEGRVDRIETRDMSGPGSRIDHHGSLGTTHDSYTTKLPARDAQPDTAAETTVSATKGKITVTIPERAEVFINGRRTASTGKRRTYVSRDLEPGRTYKYQMRFRIIHHGTTLEETRTVHLVGGTVRNVVVDFKEAAARQLASGP